MELKIGTTVKTLRPSIEAQAKGREEGQGLTGVIDGFARFSKYHGREAFLIFADQPKLNGWFWVIDLEAV